VGRYGEVSRQEKEHAAVLVIYPALGKRSPL
jgi:hypothetical protein